MLAEYTLPFNEADVTYYRPLCQHTVVATNQFPTYVTADAAYDYWYVYETVAHRQGIAAIPLTSTNILFPNEHTNEKRLFTSKTFMLKIPDMPVLPLFWISMEKDGPYTFVSPI